MIGRVWAPQLISTGFAFWQCYCSNVAHRRPTKLCTMSGHLLGWYTVYTFSGAFAPDGILSGAKLTLRPSLAFSYIGSIPVLTARHSSSGRQPNCGVVRGMELRNFRRRRHLYLAGRPSRWASANILVVNIFQYVSGNYCMKCPAAQHLEGPQEFTEKLPDLSFMASG